MSDDKSARLRLGEGPFTSPSRGNEVLQEARHWFLLAVQDANQSVLIDLRQKILPHYVLMHAAFMKQPVVGYATKELHSFHRQIISRWRRTDPPECPPGVQKAARRLRCCLVRWARSFHLNESWLLEIAMRTMERGVDLPPTADRLSWAPLQSWRNIPSVSPFVFIGRGWDPIKERRELYRANTRADFESKLREYMDEVSSHSSEALSPTPEIRSPAHFNWLARYQVNGESPKSIAENAGKNYHVSPAAVEKAIREIALLVGLPLRRRKRGRPPKTQK